MQEGSRFWGASTAFRVRAYLKKRLFWALLGYNRRRSKSNSRAPPLYHCASRNTLVCPKINRRGKASFGLQSAVEKGQEVFCWRFDRRFFKPADYGSLLESKHTFALCAVAGAPLTGTVAETIADK